jgi:nitric-oxide synthase
MATCPFTGAQDDSPAPVSATPPPDSIKPGRLVAEAVEYLDLLLGEDILTVATHAARVREVQATIARYGAYNQSPEELMHGAKVAWRNAARCIGRLTWQNLDVRDLRHVDTAEGMFEGLVEHIRSATNGGKLKPTISIFAPRAPGQPGPRIWNSQLIRYAGYHRHGHHILGDPGQVEFTDRVRALGWKGGPGTAFDVLPLVIQMPGEAPRLFDLPADAILEVKLTHPNYPWFADLGLKWHALPAVSNMRLEIGGVSYTAAPFNGWYMGTEIGARNLSDEDRYNMLPQIARGMGLRTSSNRTLWRDRALVELNVAVLHSFHHHGVAMVDHHTAFVRHEAAEQQAGRDVPGDWTCLVPPISGSASPIWPRPYTKVTLKPGYLYQKNPWEIAVPRAVAVARSEPTDALTGMLLSRALESRLDELAASGGALAVFDIDHLTALNAHHGRRVGDAVLRAIGRTLPRVLRPEDTSFRLNGARMCVLLGGIHAAGDATNVAQRIRAAVGSVYVSEAPTLAVQASMGLVLVPPGTDASQALQQARSALRQAKATGRDRLVLADPASPQATQLAA